MKVIIFASIILVFASFVSASGFGYGGEGDTVSANFGYTNIDIGGTGNKTVNISNYYNNYTFNGSDFNATQFDDSGGTISIIESWFSDLFDILFGDKDTDDLAEGSVNLYDNQSWNESHADDLYVNEDGDNMTGNLNISGNLTADRYTTSLNTSVGICTNASGDTFFGYIEGAC